MVSNWQRFNSSRSPTLNIQVLRLFMVPNQPALAVAFKHAKKGLYKDQMLRMCRSASTNASCCSCGAT